MKSATSPSIKELRKKISMVEVIIILLLILVWLVVWFFITHEKQKHIDKMITLENSILHMAVDQYGDAVYDPALKISWPFQNELHLFIIKDASIVYSSQESILPKGTPVTDAFGKALNSQIFLGHMRISESGTDWIRHDNLTDRQWITWLASPEIGAIFGIQANETYLLKLSGFVHFRFVMMICAGLASAVLLLFLIWALSWIRLSSIKGLG